ncbi:hypothetical protein, partial [Promineifilum sp.]|uniref:hypothetical protein n=1 Tax=Promineifilum sp. TaxID=2664178 RepID=UPI0035B3E915
MREPLPLSFLVRASGWLIALVVVGLLIAAVQLVPLYEVGQVNFRAGSASYEEVRGWAFPWRNAVTLLLPNFYGSPAHHSYRDVFTGQVTPLTLNAAGQPNPHGPGTSSWGIKNYVEGAAYMGLLPLLLAALGALALLRWRTLAAARRAHTLFFVGLALFSVAFIFGTPLYALLYYGLPFIDQLHTPFRWVFPLALAVAALAGFGVDEVLAGWEEAHAKGARDAKRNNLSLRPLFPLRSLREPLPQSVILGWLAVIGGVLVAVALLGSRLAYGWARPWVERLFHGLAQAGDAFPTAEAFYSYQFWWALLFAGLLVASGGVLLLATRRRGWFVAACALIVVDLYAASVGFNAAVDPALLDFTPAAVEWLQAQPGEWRLTTYDPTGAKPLNANTPWLHSLADVRGYDSIIPRQYTEFMAAIEAQNGLAFNRIQPIGSPAALDSPLLAVLGARYVPTV